MALSLSLARPAPLAVSAGAGARKLPAASLAFPAKSFFGAPLAATAASVASPLPRKPATSTTSLEVVAAGKKGYKMKTHKASAKRFRVTGRGKIVRRCAGKQHLLAKKNTKRKKRLSKMVQVNKSDYDNVTGALPYLKVNRKAN
ncbi:50S ribosomal protein L35, chloroplastic [Zea mays]|uniref:50S ribosomal protein L35 n=3 Tax=Zea mays TaxID=4577 RepID=Q84K87_MAIZE|nr:50S ribosomal protein L35, chloroplastic-like [Zea mays]ACF84226.1 unknown [Zea mays]ACG31634.1 50S ribosomal protein L35 [Zea mays]AQL04514.1 embryo specific18 [Zea mays]PWZ06028.1 50S ribosomal protein L35, chloroplastic [Zea mays]CAD24032.1 putative plastid ribosomal protein L35 [Zea mays]|eukprot:NP_001105156.1 prpl35-1 protein [Zea mays]